MSKPQLVIDLDGTLIRTDLLIESALALMKANPFYLLLMIYWLTQGKARLKGEIARRVCLDVTTLPYDERVLEYIRGERRGGRPTALATASHTRYAQRVAEHLGLFDRVFATTDEVNLAASAKARTLAAAYGEKGFVYAGNARPDLRVWRHAAAAIPVGENRRLLTEVQRSFPVECALPRDRPGVRVYLKALRVHQWLKNILIFLPVLAAHRLGDPSAVTSSILAFLAFSACASSVYLLNDLLDLPADRRHPSKRLRPFAAGTLPVEQGLVLIPALLLGAFVVALSLPPLFLWTLLIYYVATTAYSFYLKRLLMLDVVVLAGLYTIRVIAGCAATGIPLSYWLFAFSMFLFLSLAFVKRYTELVSLRSECRDNVAHGRSYEVGDLEILSSFGAAAGYLSVLVAALYISSNDVQKLYQQPSLLWGICPILLYWISRVWIIAHRGSMHDDPIIFAMKDRVSLLSGALVLAVMLSAYSGLRIPGLMP